MKKLPVLCLGLATLWLSGCAGLESQQRHDFEVRSEHVAAVEQAAQRSGVEVIWLNTPMQRRVRDIEWRREITVDKQPAEGP